MTNDDLDAIAERTAKAVEAKIREMAEIRPLSFEVCVRLVAWADANWREIVENSELYHVVLSARKTIRHRPFPMADSDPSACQGGNEGDESATSRPEETRSLE